VRHFVLHADLETLSRRIRADSPTVYPQWRLDHLEVYRKALPWLQHKGEIVDTGGRSPVEVAALIEKAVIEANV